MRLGLGILGLRQTRVRARARLRVLRWRVSYPRKRNNCFRFTPTIVQLVCLLERSKSL